MDERAAAALSPSERHGQVHGGGVLRRINTHAINVHQLELLEGQQEILSVLRQKAG
jgi:hypothetical protein